MPSVDFQHRNSVKVDSQEWLSYQFNGFHRYLFFYG